MDPLAVTRHAQSYLRSLSQGIDPLRQAPVPEDSALSQPALRRCFQFVAESLQELMDGKELQTLTQAYQAYLPAYGIPDRLTYTAQPVSVDQLFQRINGARDPKAVKKLPPMVTLVTDWLSEKGFGARLQTPEFRYQFSPLGEAAGFSFQEKQILCGEHAQRLLSWHLAELMAKKMARWLPLRDRAASGILAHFPYSQQPMTTSLLLQRINECLAQEGPLDQKVTTGIFTPWMERSGYLVLAYEADKGELRVPTPQGKALGMSLYHFAKGNRYGISYNQEAQRFVVEHLVQILDDYISPAWKPNWLTEQLLSSGVLERLACSPDPIPFNRFWELVCQAVAPIVSVSLSATPLFKWMIQEGLLEEKTREDGRLRRIPTQAGCAIGLSLHKNDNYHYALYSKEAQRFLLDRLPELLAGD